MATTLRVLLTSVLRSAGWLVLITWNVESHLKAPFEAERVTWPIGLIGGLAYGRMTVLVSKSYTQGIFARCFEGRVLHDAASRSERGSGFVSWHGVRTFESNDDEMAFFNRGAVFILGSGLSVKG